MAFDQNNKFIKTTTTTPPKKPSGEQPGSGYTWGGGTKPIGPKKPGSSQGGTIPSNPVGERNKAGTREQPSLGYAPKPVAPVNKGPHMGRIPNVPSASIGPIATRKN